MCVLLWGWAPFQSILNKVTVLIQWPMLHDIVQRMPPIVPKGMPYHAIYNLNWLAASGTACMVASILSAILLKMKLRNFLRLLLSVINQLKLPTVTVTSVLALAFLMNYCGATATLGLAFTATGRTFPFLALFWVGWESF